MDFLQLPAQDLVLPALFVIAFLVQLLFLMVRIRPLAFMKKRQPPATDFLPKASVIICAKNEAENLERFLPAILTQDYPDYQVVVVNDCSEDDSEMVLARLKQKYPRLYYTNIPMDRRFHHGKKLALTIGVKAAAYDYLVLTDADCKPASSLWLKKMMEGFSDDQKEIVLGFGGYGKTKGFLNLLIRYDTFWIAMQYLGFALSGKPYMGVGRNLAYRKNLFVKGYGFRNHSHIASGDDDLFVQEHATAKNCAVIIDREGHTLSEPPATWKNWRIQKARHLTTAPHYKSGIKLELIAEPLSREIFWLLGIVLIIFNTFALLAGGLLVVNLMLKTFFLYHAARKLGQKRLFWSVIIFDFFHPWLLLWAKTSNFSGSNKKRWK